MIQEGEPNMIKGRSLERTINRLELGGYYFGHLE